MLEVIYYNSRRLPLLSLCDLIPMEIRQWIVGALGIEIWLKKEISRCKRGELRLVIFEGKRGLVGLFF